MLHLLIIIFIFLATGPILYVMMRDYFESLIPLQTVFYLISLYNIEIIVLVGLFLSVCIFGQKFLDDKLMNKKMYIYGNCDEEYSAVLIGNNLSWVKNIFTIPSVCGLYFLEKYFKKTNKNYKIIQKIEKSDFNKIVADDKCKELYLIGHGSKGLFGIGNNTNEIIEIIDYSKYSESPKKRIIAQLHCAHIKNENNNESLMDLLAIDKKNSYVGNGRIIPSNVWLYCFIMWIRSYKKGFV